MKIDERTLKAGLAKFAKLVGESGRDAVARWGVQLCRELARQTQAWGPGRDSLEKQYNAMYGDAANIVHIVQTLKPGNKRGIYTESALNDWIEVNRTRRRARTPNLAPADKKIVGRDVFHPAMRKRILSAGMAKGAWLGAGRDIASKQTGLDRINIGKGFMPWLARHSDRGNGHVSGEIHNALATLRNKAHHSASNYVLGYNQLDRAILWAGKITLKRYEKIIQRKSK